MAACATITVGRGAQVSPGGSVSCDRLCYIHAIVISNLRVRLSNRFRPWHDRYFGALCKKVLETNWQLPEAQTTPNGLCSAIGDNDE